MVTIAMSVTELPATPSSRWTLVTAASPRSRELSAAAKARLAAEYYQTYDVMTGVRIAATLGGLVTLFSIFLFYKSRFRSYSRDNLCYVPEGEPPERGANRGADFSSAQHDHSPPRSGSPLAEMSVWTVQQPPPTAKRGTERSSCGSLSALSGGQRSSQP